MKMSVIFNNYVTLPWHNTKTRRGWYNVFCGPYDEHVDDNNVIFYLEMDCWS